MVTDSREVLFAAVYGGGEDAVTALREYLEMRDGVAEAITDAFANPGWIAACDRLPPNGDTVWVFENGEVIMGEYHGQDGFQSYGASMDREGLNSERLLGVTHWMEIEVPEPPA